MCTALARTEFSFHPVRLAARHLILYQLFQIFANDTKWIARNTLGVQNSRASICAGRHRLLATMPRGQQRSVVDMKLIL